MNDTSPSVISVDYLGKNMYWVDDTRVYVAGLTKGTSKYKRAILYRKVRIHAFALNPIHG